MSRPPSLLFIFLDGLGLGPAHPKNPLHTIGLPQCESLWGTRLCDTPCIRSRHLTLRGIDACLGVEGLPQSATGQTTLFTGINAARYLGMHLSGFPNAALRAVINEHSLFKKFTESGSAATFANAYRPTYFEQVGQGKRRHSVTTVAAMAAGLTLRTTAQLAARQALYWDITGTGLQETADPVDPVSADTAADTLISLCREHALVVFESFETDLAGHRPHRTDFAQLLGKIDQFLFRCFTARAPEQTIVVTSDHGNCEDLSTPSHTRNPVPLIALGPLADRFAAVDDLCGVYHAIVGCLDSAAHLCD